MYTSPALASYKTPVMHRWASMHFPQHNIRISILRSENKYSYAKPSPSRVNKIKIYPSVHFSVQANFIAVYIWLMSVYGKAHDIS